MGVVVLIFLRAIMRRSGYLVIVAVISSIGVFSYFFKKEQTESAATITVPSSSTNISSNEGAASGTAIKLPEGLSVKQPPIFYRPTAVDFMGNAVDLDGKTVGKYISELAASAQRGDPDSNFRIYRALTICARAAEQQSTLNNLPIGTTDPNLLSSLQSWIALAKSVCADASEIQITRDRLDGLKKAADLGLVDAQLAFFFEGPNGQMYDFSTQDNDPNIVEWKQVAIGYLIKAGNAGNQLALSVLSKAYEDGEVVPKDLKVALTYAVAESNKRNIDPGTQTVVNSLARQLSPDEVRVAIAAGNAIVAPSRN